MRLPHRTGSTRKLTPAHAAASRTWQSTCPPSHDGKVHQELDAKAINVLQGNVQSQPGMEPWQRFSAPRPQGVETEPVLLCWIPAALNRLEYQGEPPHALPRGVQGERRVMSNGPRPLCFVQVAPVQACPALGSGCLPACGTRDKSFPAISLEPESGLAV